jgi:RNA polymerase sigma-70 factor (ECF subfamily)
LLYKLTTKALYSKRLYSNDTLVLQLKKGDKKAFEIIFDQYKTKLYFFALGYLHTAIEAEEVVQNAFLSLWEHRQSLDETLSVKNYLYKTIVNSVYNFLKHEAIRRKYVDYTLSHELEEDDYSQRSIYFNDLKQTIDSLIEQLPVQQQKIFKMSRWDGLSHDEIARYLGLSVRSVENHVYRALKFIKENLREEYLIGA